LISSALKEAYRIKVNEDICVPRGAIVEMIRRCEVLARESGVPIAVFGHAGDGNLHPTSVVDLRDLAAIERVHKAFADIFAAAIDMDGTITGEHGVGAAKLPFLEGRLGADQMALLRRIKSAFDPAGILNPGKLGS
jgi:glycolate oxidase